MDRGQRARSILWRAASVTKRDFNLRVAQSPALLDQLPSSARGQFAPIGGPVYTAPVGLRQLTRQLDPGVDECNAQ